MQMPDGTVIAREKGTPQGSPISRCWLTCSCTTRFDTWMDRNSRAARSSATRMTSFAHCDTGDQARQLRAPSPSGSGPWVLNCIREDEDRVLQRREPPGGLGHASFDFLGYTFRGSAWPRKKRVFHRLSPAISGQAKKAKGKQIRDCTSTSAAARTCPAWLRRSILRSRAGSKLLRGLHRSELCFLAWRINEHLAGGPCRSSGDSAASTPKRWPGCRRCIQYQPTLFAPLAAHRVHLKPDCGGGPE